MQSLANRISSNGTTYTATQVSQMINAVPVQSNPALGTPYALSPGGIRRTRMRLEHWSSKQAGFIQDLTPTVQRITVTYDEGALVPVGAEVQFRHIPGPTGSFLGSFLEGTSIPANALTQGYYSFPSTPFQPIRWNTDFAALFLDLGSPDGGWIEFQLGTFLLTIPQSTVTTSSYQDTVQLHDQSQLLISQKMQQYYTLNTGDNLIGHPGDVATPSGGCSVYGLLAAAGFKADASVLPTLWPNIAPAETSGVTGLIVNNGQNPGTPIVWPWGTSYLQAINDILALCGYYPLWFDGLGRPTSRPALPALINGQPVKPTPVYCYTSDFGKMAALGLVAPGGTLPGQIILPPVTARSDLTNVANVVQVSTQDPSSPGGYVARNFTSGNNFSTSRATDAASISASQQGYDIYKLVEDNNISDQNFAYQRAQREVYLASQLFQSVALPIGCNPAHEPHDWITFYVRDDLYGVAEVVGYQIEFRVGNPNAVGQASVGRVGNATNQSAGGASDALRLMTLTLRFATDLGSSQVDYHGMNGYTDHLWPTY